MSALRLPGVDPGEPPPLDRVLWRRVWPSRLDRKMEILDTVSASLVGKGQVDDEDLPWLALCLDEVLVNAMVHGNESDPTQPLTVTVGERQGRWAVLVEDRGTGFTAASVPDQEDPGNLLLEHGRGIRLMLEWLDHLSYWRGGTAALLERRPSSARVDNQTR